MKNEIKSGMMLNYAYVVLLNVTTLFVTPALTGSLGARMYGIYVIAFSVISFIPVGDFGIGTPVISYVVKFLNSDDKTELPSYLHGTLMIYGAFSGIILVLCALFYIGAPYFFGGQFTAEELVSFRQMFVVASANCVFQIFQNYLFVIITGCGKLIFTRVTNIVRVIMRAAMIIAVLATWLPVYMVFTVELVLSVGIVAIYSAYAVSLGIRIRRYAAKTADVIDTAKSIALSCFMFMFENTYLTLCPFIIGMSIPAEEVGRYSIGITFCTVYIQLSATFSQLRMTKLSELWHTRDSGGGYWTYIISSGRMQAAALGGILIGFIVFGRQFLILWVGEQFIISYYIGLLVMAAMFFSLSQAMLEVSLYAQNKYTVRTVVFFISAAANCLLLPVGIMLFGLMGTAYVLALTTFAVNFIVMNIYFSKTHRRMSEFNAQVIARLLPAIIISSAVGVLISLVNYESIIIAALASAAALVIYAAAIFFTYISKEQRTEVIGFIGKLNNK